jgi:4-diphosphocytidyl-2-C-methyl-D-erythritol kinase
MTRMGESVRIAAHAKLNLALAVAPPEPAGSPKAGWHRIASWFHALALHDDVELAALPSGPTRVRIEWAPDAPRPSPIDWPVERDLAARAHALLEAHAGRSLACDMLVRKRIPVGGGLGGGSSDAAATLVGLNRLFDLGVPASELQRLSAALGSDIAYFIDDDHTPPRPAIVEGFGDVIERVGRVPAPVELIFPPFGCDTRAVYRAFDQLLPPGHTLRDAAVRRMTLDAARSGTIDPVLLFNDLLAPADAVAGSRLSAILAGMAGTPVHMSGSGSTLFRIGARDGAIAPPGSARVHTMLV